LWPSFENLNLLPLSIHRLKIDVNKILKRYQPMEVGADDSIKMTENVYLNMTKFYKRGQGVWLSSSGRFKGSDLHPYIYGAPIRGQAPSHDETHKFLVILQTAIRSS
jgi:hypothetical protein